jgi:hypothetical protein
MLCCRRAFSASVSHLASARLVLQIEVEDQAQNAGGRALDEKQPLPAMQTVDAIHIFENGAAQRAGHNRHGHDG